MEGNNGLFGPVRIGPMIGFGILMGPNVSIESKIYKYFGFSVSYAKYDDLDVFKYYDARSSINKSPDYSVNSAEISYRQYEAKFSLYPFGGAFFIGAAYGQRLMAINAGGTVNNIIIPNFGTIAAVPVNFKFDIDTIYLTPQIGWLANWESSYGGFAIGTEFGVQLEIKNKVQDELVDKLKQYPFPYWNILKLGWLF